jgi:signal transduction histidine kinase
MAGLLSLVSVPAFFWIMENTTPPGIFVIPLGLAYIGLTVVPSAYLVARRFSDDPAAVAIARRVAVAAVMMIAFGLVFVAGVKVGQYSGPAPPLPELAGSTEGAHVPGMSGEDEAAVMVAIVSIIVPGGLAFAGLVVGPWLYLVVRTLARALTRERAARARAEERAKVATHLHDSVLQALVLLQKLSTDPREVVRLARHTERDLRAWLYGPVGGGDDLATALALAAAAVEDRFGVAVDLVTAGTCPLDERTRAIVGAAQEAMTNAARHAGISRVSVFADVADGEVLVRVRDRGCGYDQTRGASRDRHGVRDSIVGRMRSHGGRSSIRSAVGEGTEVELRMPDGAAMAGAGP